MVDRFTQYIDPINIPHFLVRLERGTAFLVMVAEWSLRMIDENFLDSLLCDRVGIHVEYSEISGSSSISRIEPTSVLV